MKKLFWIFFLTAGWSIGGFAQTPGEPVQQASFSPIDIFNTQEVTPVVIIDDDELGVTISPNPATDHINIHVNGGQNLSNKTFKMTNSLGVLVLQQGLSNSTVDISNLGSGTYNWAVTNPQNHKVADGILIVQ